MYKVAKILEIKEEAKDIKTFTLDLEITAKPGQFLMLWIPGINEKPFSFSKLKPLEITVKKVGEFTSKLFSLKKNSKLWVRGPYGNGFSLKGEKILLIAGGIGIAPLLALMEVEKDKSFTLLYGAKTKAELISRKRLERENVEELIIATDDGSFGLKGNITEILKRKINLESYDFIAACGPEKMLKEVVKLSLEKGVDCQVSIERYIKCALGICGSCCLDPKGLLVCKDGPVFYARDLVNSEFGLYKRDASSSKIYLGVSNSS